MKDYNEGIGWWVDVIFYNLSLMLSELSEDCGRGIHTLAGIRGHLTGALRQFSKEMKEFFCDLHHNRMLRH